ncbi:hypothetical protein VaNZ11_014191 [Volvox africanus]|uniref:DUF4203 domain-containing protein n=1 Tax=Volvox africanus TaxID=51714 RepID=A0ABQ5SIU8_9CHLO|nr:hypothetical protein VaNZ11_014191 [Volvox africanus]
MAHSFNPLTLTMWAIVVLSFLCVADTHMGASFGPPAQKRSDGVSGLLLSRILKIWSPTNLKSTSSGLPGTPNNLNLPSIREAVIDPPLEQQPSRCAIGLPSGCGVELPISVTKSTGYIGAWKSAVSTAGQLFEKCVIKKALDEVNFRMVGTVLAGCALVLYANWMSKSMAFRVTGGGLVVGLMMGTIIFCWLRRTLRLGGCSVIGAIVGMSAWMAGFWRLPSLTFLITNTYLLACVGFFWFIGSASVYVGGAGMNNPRLETLLALSFRLLGHVLLYIGLWKHETLALCVQMLALLYCVLPTSLRRFFWRTVQFGFEDTFQDPHAPLRLNCGPHPLVVNGFIWNRLMVAIPIDGPEFRELLAQGYEPNVYSGKMELVSGSEYPQ